MEKQKYSIVQQMLQSAQQTQESCTEATGVLEELELRSRFNAAEDVNALEKATTAKEIDEAAIIDILTKRTNKQRQETKVAYKKQAGKSLEEVLKKVLSGQLGEVLLNILKTPAEFDASELNAAIRGPGSSEDTIAEILATRSIQQIKQIKDTYKEDFKTELEMDIIDNISGDFQKALLALLKGDRSEDCYVNKDLADKDAKALFDAGENSKKTDVSVFINILTTRSFIHLRQVFRDYAKYSNHDSNKALDLKMNGDIESSLVTIAKVAVSKPEYFAEKLDLAMKGLGNQDKIVNRIMISQHGVDMKGIKAQFQKLTGKPLRDDLMDKTKGKYQTVILTLASYD